MILIIIYGSADFSNQLIEMHQMFKKFLTKYNRLPIE